MRTFKQKNVALNTLKNIQSRKHEWISRNEPEKPPQRYWIGRHNNMNPKTNKTIDIIETYFVWKSSSKNLICIKEVLYISRCYIFKTIIAYGGHASIGLNRGGYSSLIWDVVAWQKINYADCPR